MSDHSARNGNDSQDKLHGEEKDSAVRGRALDHAKATAFASLQRQYSGLIDPTLAPSGILLSSPWTVESLGSCDGSDGSARIDPEQWLKFYSAAVAPGVGVLQSSNRTSSSSSNSSLRADSATMTPQSLPTVETLHTWSTELESKGVIPLCVALIRYDHVTAEFIHNLPIPKARVGHSHTAAVSATVRGTINDLLQKPGNVAADQSVFAAALPHYRYKDFSVLPLTCQGLKPRFMLDRRFVVSNVNGFDIEKVSVEADFGDGQGFRKLQLDETVQVEYAYPGHKNIDLRVRYSTHSKSHIHPNIIPGNGLARSTLIVEYTGPTPPPSETWTIQADIDYPKGSGVKNFGKLYVLYGYDSHGHRHTSLQNAVLLVEGFPGSYSYEFLYAQFNQQNLLNALLNNGFDAVICSFVTLQDGMPGGTDFIQRSAFVVVKAIQTINSHNPQKLQIIGVSMGGVVSRYALTYMQAFNCNHGTSQFITFDSPHVGANVPVGVQAAIQWLATSGDSGDSGKRQAKILSCESAQQMLIAQAPIVNNINDTIHISYLPAKYTKFYTSLYMLFPLKDMKTGVITNGEGSGRRIIDEGDLEMQCWLEPYDVTLFGADSKCTPGVSDWFYSYWDLGEVGKFDKDYYYLPIFVNATTPYNQPLPNLDGGCGGSSDVPGQAAKQIYDGIIQQKSDSKDILVSVDHPVTCFIPTCSSIAPKKFLDGDLPLFDEVKETDSMYQTACISQVNTPHVTVTPQITKYLFDQFGLEIDLQWPIETTKKGDGIAYPDSAIASCQLGGKLYAFWSASNQIQCSIYTATSGDFSLPKPINGTLINNPNPPAACVFSNAKHAILTLHVFWQDGSNLYTASMNSNDGSFSDSTKLPFNDVGSAPFAVKFLDDLYLLWVNGSQQICLATSSDGWNWTGGKHIHGSPKVGKGSAVSAVRLDRGTAFARLLLYYTDEKFNLFRASLEQTLDGKRHWKWPKSGSALIKNKDGQSPSAPAVCVFSGQVYLFFQAINHNNNIYWTSSPESSTGCVDYQYPDAVPVKSTYFTDKVPTAAFFGPQIFLMWKGAGQQSFKFAS